MFPMIQWNHHASGEQTQRPGHPLAIRATSYHFSDICKIFEDTEGSLISTWEKNVLKRLPLRVHYGKLADDFTSYSFISDTRNKCS